MGIVSGEKFPNISERKQNFEGEDEWCCHLLSEAEVGLLSLYMGVTSQETSSIALNLIAM